MIDRPPNGKALCAELSLEPGRESDELDGEGEVKGERGRDLHLSRHLLMGGVHCGGLCCCMGNPDEKVVSDRAVAPRHALMIRRYSIAPAILLHRMP